MSDKVNLCVYHDDADGFASALALWMKFEDRCEYVPIQYRDKPPVVKGRNVFILDFSFSREILEKMKREAESLLVIDHHKTAAAELEGLDYCIFDMEKSGAVLAFEHFHAKKKLPDLFKYIQDRDLWEWKLPYSREFSAALNIQSKTFERWNELCDDSDVSRTLREQGKAILAYQEMCVDSAISNGVKIISLHGLNIPMINCTHLISETVGKLAEKYPFAIGYFDLPDRRVFNLRSRKRGVDVSEIAKTFGGGGHAAAAGFHIKHGSFSLFQKGEK